MEKMELRCNKVKHIAGYVLLLLFILFCCYVVCSKYMGNHPDENAIATSLLIVFILLAILAFSVFTFISGWQQLVVIDEEGIQTTKWKVQWDDVVSCYVDYGAHNCALLEVQTNSSLLTYSYDIDCTKYDRFEVGHFIDKMAGRNVFDIGKSAEEKGSNIAWLVSGLVGSAVALFADILMRNYWLGILVGIGFGFAIYRVIKKAWVKRDWKKWRKGVV
ncbi:MAG: hypothetical protein II951_00170 [Bacteroidales bacterium]|nr:hypothetical protein [Bacteroidales bacterium]